MGDYDAALAEFQRTLDGVEGAASGTANGDLRDLAILALGRVHYELEDWDAALDTYSRVPRGSLRYDEALYEISWTLIRQEMYRDAIENLEILMLIADDEEFVPEAQLLIGDLLLRQEQYESAVSSFFRVEENYAPIERELQELIDEHSNPIDFFDSLVSHDSGTLRLPDVALAWVENDDVVDRAMALTVDLSELEHELDESRQVMRELDAVLNSENRVEIFPTLREGWGYLVELRTQLTDAHAALVDYESDALWNSLPTDARLQYTALRDARIALQEEYLDLPRTFAEIDEREMEVVAEIESMILETYRAEQEIEATREELASMMAVLQSQVRTGDRFPDEARLIRSEIQTVEAELDRRAGEARRLREELSVRVLEVGIADPVGQAERDLKARYEASLERESEFLAGYHTLAPSMAGDFARIDALETRIASASDDIDTAFGDIDLIVDEQTAEYRELLVEEEARLRQYERTLAEYNAQGSQLAGEIAYDSFLGVLDRIRELTLRANVGIIDVAWRQKEELSDRIDDLFEERNRQLRVSGCGLCRDSRGMRTSHVGHSASKLAAPSSARWLWLCVLSAMIAFAPATNLFAQDDDDSDAAGEESSGEDGADDDESEESRGVRRARDAVRSHGGRRSRGTGEVDAAPGRRGCQPGS